MGKPKQFDIIFNRPRKVYMAGDTVTGSVILHLDEALLTTNLDLIIAGKSTVQFSKDTGGKHRTHYMDSERYFKTEINLHPTSGIPVGQHQFPFSYVLPSRIPSSFESHHSNVRYSVKASLKLKWTKTIEVKRFFVVFRPLDLNRTEYANLPNENESELSMCCASGKITALIRLQKYGFVPGETVPVRAEVQNNTSSRITKMYFTIEQSYECYAGGRSESGSKMIKSARPPVEHEGVAAHSSAVWDAVDVVTVPVTVPSGLDGCNIIDVKHRVVLNLVMAGSLTCNRIAGVDMLIGTVPLASQHGIIEAPSHQPTLDSAYYHREEYPRNQRNDEHREMEDMTELPSYSEYTAAQAAERTSIYENADSGTDSQIPRHSAISYV